MWEGRRNEHANIASLLVANTITGAASLFRREVADLALPFPEAPGWLFHDHWLGLVALATGDVAYVDRPLYDYVQHGEAVFGDGAEGPRRPGRLARRPGRLLLRLPAAAGAGGDAARAMRARLTPDKRRALRWFAAADRGRAAFAWLLARPLRRSPAAVRRSAPSPSWRGASSGGISCASAPARASGRATRRTTRPARPLARARSAARSGSDAGALVNGRRQCPVVIEARGLQKTFRIPAIGSTR